MAGKRKRPAAASSRFKVYRPAEKPEPDGKPNARRFNVYKPKTREPEPPPDSRVVSVQIIRGDGPRFVVYRPPAEPKRNQPNGSCWIAVDGRWLCEYGCKTFPIKEAPNGVEDNDYHAYDCPYWWEVGINETPF